LNAFERSILCSQDGIYYLIKKCSYYSGWWIQRNSCKKMFSWFV